VRIDEQLKRQLARELCAIISGWTLREAMNVMYVDPSRISALRNGKLAGFSIARLVRLIAVHGYDVELVLRPMKRPAIQRQCPTATVVRHDRFDRRISAS
jgi:predicted XRE-type DNA-binding protein